MDFICISKRQCARGTFLQAWLIGMVESKESAPGPMVLFSTECPPGLEAKVKDLKEDSFTLVLDEEGKVEMSCEDEEGRMFNRTEWGTEFVFNQLQVLFSTNFYIKLMFQSSAIDRIQLFWMDQSEARAQAHSGTNPGHHFGREVGTI